MSTPQGFCSLSTKLLELRGLIETARWTLLDVTVMVDELQNQLNSQLGAAETSDEFATDPNHEDHIPGGDQG